MALDLDTLEEWLRAQPADMQLGGNSVLALVVELRAARKVVEAARAASNLDFENVPACDRLYEALSEYEQLVAAKDELANG